MNQEEELADAIKELYTAFSVYQLHSRTTGCPCCVSESDIAKLHAKTLRNLESEDLSRYTFKAMTTWGTEGDFKHFLPRILELFSRKAIGVETSIVLGKLVYAGWDAWPEAEKKPVIRVLLAAWVFSIRNHRFHLEELIWTSRLMGKIDELLAQWPLDPDSTGFENYVDLILNHFYDLAYQQKELKDMPFESIEKLKHWIRENAGLLEERFFYHAEKNPVFAEKISDAQYRCEWTKW